MKALERFKKYIAFDTKSNEENECCPSTPGQLVLGKALVEELKSFGLEAEQDEHGYVYSCLKSNCPECKKTIGFIAHMDTAPDLDGKCVNPQVFVYKGGDIKLNDEAAKLLYLGIVGDTGRFLFPNTSNNTLQVASELIKYNFNMSELLDKLEITSENLMRFRAFIFEKYDVYQDGVAYLKITKEDMDKYGVDPGEVSTGVNLLRSLEGLYAWCFAIDEGNKVRVRIRSKGPVINTLAEKYAGGGHPLASGATVKNWEEFDDLLDDMARVVAEYIRENK